MEATEAARPVDASASSAPTHPGLPPRFSAKARGGQRPVVGICKHCHRDRVELNRYQLLCLDRCYPEFLESRKSQSGSRLKRIGDMRFVSVFERCLGENAAACMTELSATLGGKMIYPKAVQYYVQAPDNPSATQVFCMIVGKYDPDHRALPELRDTYPDGHCYIPKRLGRFKEFNPTSAPALFSLADYLQPSTANALKALQDLTGQMNATAQRVLMPSEIMLAVTLYHANVAQLQKPTVSNLFEVFRRVLLIAQGLRVQEQATVRFNDNQAKVITASEVQKIVNLLRAERDLMGEIGGSPRAAKKLGLTSGDALSSMVERAPRPGHTGTLGAGQFDAARETEQAHRALTQEASGGPDALALGGEPMPEAEVDEMLREVMADLGRDA